MKTLILELCFFALFLTCINQSMAVIDSSTIEAMWLFDDVQGETVIDSSGHGRHGTIQGGVEWVNGGKFGKALEFNGVDGEVVITGYKGIAGNTPRTTVVWFKTEKAGDQRLVCWGANATANKYHVRIHEGPFTLRVETQGGQLYSTGTELNDGEWHHLAVVLPEDSDMCHDHILYVDGEVEENRAGNNVGVDTDVTANDVELGYNQWIGHGDYAQGTMDEVAIFSVPLTQDDVKSIMLQGLSSTVLSVSPGGKLATTWGSLRENK